MKTKLDKLRDEESQRIMKSILNTKSPWCNPPSLGDCYGYGFDDCRDILLPIIEQMREALEQYSNQHFESCSIRYSDCDCELNDIAFKTITKLREWESG